MNAAGPSEPELLHPHARDPSGGSHNARSSSRLSQRSHRSQQGEEDDFDDEDEFDYQHERLPSQPAQLDFQLPHSELDLTMTFNSILKDVVEKEEKEETDRVQKRQSNVMKLAEQNEKLKEELRAMTERLEAAERKQRDLEARAQQRRSGESTH